MSFCHSCLFYYSNGEENVSGQEKESPQATVKFKRIKNKSEIKKKSII